MEQEGRPLPSGYLDRPGLIFGAEFFWFAFWEITTDRPLGFGGEGRIPYTAIRSFANDYGITSDSFSWFLAVIREMDAEYLGMRAPTQGQLIEEIKVTDAAGIRGLLHRLAKKPVSSAA